MPAHLRVIDAIAAHDTSESAIAMADLLRQAMLDIELIDREWASVCVSPRTIHMTGQTRRSRHDQPTAIELLERVADRTLVFDFSVWQWGDAIAIDGLLDASELLGSPRYRDFVAGFYRRWATRSLGWMDHLTPGAALLRLPDPRSSGLVP